MTELGFAWWCWMCGRWVAGGQGIMVERAAGHTSRRWIRGPSPHLEVSVVVSCRQLIREGPGPPTVLTFHLPWPPRVWRLTLGIPLSAR